LYLITILIQGVILYIGSKTEAAELEANVSLNEEKEYICMSFGQGDISNSFTRCIYLRNTLSRHRAAPRTFSNVKELTLSLDVPKIYLHASHIPAYQEFILIGGSGLLLVPIAYSMELRLWKAPLN
jgi:hypothetical protein